ncbi:MAG: L-serine ammonia-lyase, iron-sulfur-dependent, subunit alpha [Candidatus Aminicenantes bacterium]|nr:L-serine ammonia-lyase, iron-sulfur-dependent, subunit alpha [Candidatus Aminicenantes bacterium]
MKPVSIFNDVLGPVMRGPSSSHTAASYRLGRLARQLLGEKPTKARVIFGAGGSYARVYREQNSDLAFVAGIMGLEITEARFFEVLELASAAGCQVEFGEEPIPQNDHPNAVRLELVSPSGRKIVLLGRSIGGGAVEIKELNGWPLLITGDYYETLLEIPEEQETTVRNLVGSYAQAAARLETIKVSQKPGLVLLRLAGYRRLSDEEEQKLYSVSGLTLWQAHPVSFVVAGQPLFKSAAEMVKLAATSGQSLGQVALRYEAELLGMKEEEVLGEMDFRLKIMLSSVATGLKSETLNLKLLEPTAEKIFQAEQQGKLLGGHLTRAAIRAMAAEHVAASGGVVCAAPTGGSAGTIPGIVSTLIEDVRLPADRVVLSLLAAGAVGLVIAYRATFAAEIAGCQVEIGAAGAMGAAAVVEAAGGTAEQACDAAAISFQNTMGLVCDLVQGICEIPCHTRNAVAAASAFICADLILGGYKNHIPLDETIDAVLAVGRTMPPELRVTSLGGLAVCPSALALKKKERKN